MSLRAVPPIRRSLNKELDPVIIDALNSIRNLTNILAKSIRNTVSETAYDTQRDAVDAGLEDGQLYRDSNNNIKVVKI